MKSVLVTGAKGFVGKNLCSVLKKDDGIEVLEYDLQDNPAELDAAIGIVEFIIHLAGVNRPTNPQEFETGNTGSIETICTKLRMLGRAPKIVLSSSIQAELDNPYGVSKRKAENILHRFTEDTGAACVVYRLKNLFGKWCRPNYNSVTATFCHNIANDLPIQISNRANVMELTHIDDVVAAFVKELDSTQSGFQYADPLPSTTITLGELAEKLYSFKAVRDRLFLPDLQYTFEHRLYSTYLSYLAKDNFDYGLEIKADQRGNLAEFLKSPSMGQIFVSRTKPGVTRGDHYHHTKTEKFLVLQGTALIRFRHIASQKVIEYTVRGDEYRVLDIPPGYTHSIENIGQDELVTLFWASEVFDTNHPDTFYDPVLGAEQR